MKHHAKELVAVASMWVAVAACDVATEVAPKASADAHGAANVVVEDGVTFEAEAKTELAAEVVLEPASFELEAVAKLVEQGEVESPAELEVLLNDEERAFTRIDIDADGTIDHVQVVEADADEAVEADVVLELRAVPSSTHAVEAAVTFATLSFALHPIDPEVEVRASFTHVVRQPEPRVYVHVAPVEIDAGVVIGGSAFVAWAYAEQRPVYMGVYVVDERGQWIPPGHVKHGHWKATGPTSTRGDAHGKVEVKGKGKESGGRVVVDLRGGTKGSTKVKLGGGKGGAKAHGGHGSGGSAKVSGKGRGKGGSSKGGKGK